MKEEKLKKLSLLKYGLKIIFEHNKKVFVIAVIEALAAALFPIVPAFISADIINGLVAGRSASYLFAEGIIAAVVTAVMYFGMTMCERYLQNESFYLEMWEREQYMKVLLNIDYEYLENTEFKALIKSCRTVFNNNGGVLWMLILFVQEALKGIFGLIVSLGFLAPTLIACFKIDNSQFLTSWKILAILGASIAVVEAAMLIIANDLSKKNIKSSRLQEYTFAKFMYWFFFPCKTQNAKETRIFKADKLIMQESEELLQENIQEAMNFRKNNMSHSPFLSALQGVITGILYLFIALKAYAGVFGPGNIVLFIGAMDSIVSAVSFIGNLPYRMAFSVERLEFFKKLQETKPIKYVGTLPTEKRTDYQYDVEFRNVTFAYPGTDAPVLKNVSVKFKIGERLAVVGKNGSGKTTFIKLLCRLYDPQEGQILLNGIDIKKYEPKEYMNIFSVVFQDFKLFSAPLDRNVAATFDYEEDLLWDSLEKAGIADRVRSMPLKEKTTLYKDFDDDGVEISGGEAQKLALARALYKSSPFIILDEPTAALDPISEADIYKRFNSFVGQKTAVYISHRLSSCRFCDKIAVFDKGQIVQVGNHDELVADENGIYYKLWNAQAQYYI